MNKHIQQYLNSFKLGKEFLPLFLTDLISLSIIIFAFTWFSSYTQQRSFLLLQGRTTEELQQMLVSLNPQQLLPFMNALKWFLITSVVGLVVLIIGSLFLFSYSRARIWNYLQGKKVGRNYWRWNVLHLSLFVPFLLFLAVILVVKIILMLLLSLPEKIMPVFYITHTSLMENIRVAIDGGALFYLVVLFMVIIFLIYNHFAKSYKAWESIGAGFSAFKKNWKKTLLVTLLAAITALVVTVIFLPIRKALLFYPLYTTLVNVLLAAFFLAWLSQYVFHALAHGHQ